MASTQLRTGWGTLVQQLVDSEGQGVRARILLECVAREPWVEACGLWRRAKGAAGWTCILLRGSHEMLPDADFLDEVASGRKPADFVPRRGVLLSGQGAGALALTYAGSAAAEADLDLLSGLLHVTRLVDAAESGDRSARVEAFVPALPRTTAEREPRPRELRECQPALLLANLRDSESRLCARTRIAFELELAPDVDGCRVHLPPDEFERAVQNLVSNAREALETWPEGGRIRVCLRRTLGAQLILSVEDTGPGLPAPILEALRGAGPECLPGPGLGLAVSWGILLEAGGRISALESSASGTRIELLLPAAGPV